MPQRTSTKEDPFPSAPQATTATMSPGGPVLIAPKKAPVKKVVPPVKKVPVKAPVAKKVVAPVVKKPINLFRPGTKQSLRVGVPKPALRGPKVIKRIATATKRLAGPTATRQVIKQGPRTIIKTAGKTKILGPKRNIVVTKTGSKIVNKGTGTVVRQRKTATGTRVVKTWGSKTATKADDARAVKTRTAKRAAVTYTGPKGGKVTVARRAGTPRKIRVHITGPGGKTRHKIIGPKRTKIIGPGGKVRIRKTRYISPKRRQNVTPRAGERGYAPGNTKPVKKATGTTTPTPTKTTAATRYGRGDWATVRGFRRRRLKRGARYNKSLTPSELRAVASRRLS